MKMMEAGAPKLRKLAEKVKSMHMQHDSSYVPDKQIHRWEGEGGAEYVQSPRVTRGCAEPSDPGR